MTVTTDIRRNTGHPWDGRPGFDVMFFSADSDQELKAFVQAAERKFWNVWIIGYDEGTGKPGGAMFKPSGAIASWHDSPENPHPGEIRWAHRGPTIRTGKGDLGTNYGQSFWTGRFTFLNRHAHTPSTASPHRLLSAYIGTSSVKVINPNYRSDRREVV